MKKPYNKNLIEAATFYLLSKEPLYGNLVLDMNKEYTTRVETAGVSISSKGVNLVVNPYFWESMSVLEQVDVLKHELNHIVRGHLSRAAELEPIIKQKIKHKYDNEEEYKEALTKQIIANVKFQRLNISADFAINGFLKNLPREMKSFDKNGNIILHPETIKNEKDEEIPNPKAGEPVLGRPFLVEDLQKKYPDFEKVQTMEYYYDFLNKNPDACQGEMCMVGNHGIWLEGDLSSDYVKEKIRNFVNKAVDKTKAESRHGGHIPHELIQAIEELNKVPRNWKQDLRKFIARSFMNILESTRKRRNRRYGIQQPGRKISVALHLALLIDTSGSIGDEELEQFFAEIMAIYSNGAKITLVEFDTQINGIKEIARGYKPVVHGRGGTHFYPAFEAAEKLNVDGIICFTDGGDGGEEVKVPKVPVLWALVGDSAEEYLPYKWGKRIKVEIKNKAA